MSTNDKNKSKAPKSPKVYHGLDVKKIAIVDLGQHTSIRSAMERRNSEARNFGRILTEQDMVQFRAELKKHTQAGAYFYLNNDNKLVYFGEFASDDLARTHGLTKMFGTGMLMIANGAKLTKALENIQQPKPFQPNKPHGKPQPKAAAATT